MGGRALDYHYSNEQLDAWAPKVKELSTKVKRVYGYFNNHYHGYAPENCLQLLEKLGLLSEAQKKAKAKTVVKQSQLGAFLGVRSGLTYFGRQKKGKVS